MIDANAPAAQLEKVGGRAETPPPPEDVRINTPHHTPDSSSGNVLGLFQELIKEPSFGFVLSKQEL